MAALTGQAVQNSYEQILHVDRDGGGNGTTLVDVKDGDNGTTFALRLSTDKVAFSATLNFYASVSAGGTTYFRMVADDGNTLYVWFHHAGGGVYQLTFNTSPPA